MLAKLMLSIAYRNITPISTTNTNSQTMAASITEAHLACLSTVIQVNRYIRFLSQPFDCSSYRWSILSINRFYSFQLVYCTLSKYTRGLYTLSIILCSLQWILGY